MSNLIDQCRDIKKLHPLVRVMLNLALADIRGQGINPLVVETYRPVERQQYLYCQGRSITECIAAGINKSFATSYSAPRASKVTWTMNSIHIQRKAVDVVPQRVINGKLTAIWNSQDKQTKAIIATMLKCGFEPGANWKSNPDSPHFQVKGDFTNTFCADHTNQYVTMAVQIALNKKIGAGLDTDGAWGAKTTAAVNAFRKKQGWMQNGKLGAIALKKLLS
ncbi:MAG: cwlK 1 [Lachnospiraceae bacterium]|nr:cwlK 1 [Lachnospiraceae bacterium]